MSQERGLAPRRRPHGDEARAAADKADAQIYMLKMRAAILLGGRALFFGGIALGVWFMANDDMAPKGARTTEGPPVPQEQASAEARSIFREAPPGARRMVQRTVRDVGDV